MKFFICFSSANKLLSKKKNSMQEINIAKQEEFAMESEVPCPRRQAPSAVGLGLAVGCSQLIQFANPRAALPSWELPVPVNSSSSSGM